MKKIRIGFFGTPSLASAVLEDLLQDEKFEVVFVVTNPDKPFWRNQEIQKSPVKILAEKHQIPVLQPIKLRENTLFFEEIQAYDADYFVVVAYGKIVPKEVLDAPKKMCINIHGSILPKYRGASPIQSVLLNAEKETGVTIMKMDEKMDEGDIICVQKIEIAEDETSTTLFEKFAKISGKTLIQSIDALENKTVTLAPQSHTDATYCKKIEKEDGKIDWSKSAKDIYHMWQAYTPWPGIFTEYTNKKLLLEKIQHEWMILNEQSEIGNVTKLDDGRIGVVCGKWILTLEQVKLEWKKSQNIRDFVNGNRSFIGSKI